MIYSEHNKGLKDNERITGRW